ncbi:MAG: two-component regulator propeller domain-containing protein [Saprospiraceae bacterium]
MAFCIRFLPLDAQEYTIQADLVSTDAGLSGITVYSIEKDPNGFAWISTSNGLDRYDGTEFQYHTKDEYFDEDDIITHIATNTDDELWLFSYSEETSVFNQIHINEIVVFDIITKRKVLQPKLDKIQSFFEKSDFYLVKSPPNACQLFFANQQGELWAYQSGDFYRFPGSYSGMVNRVIKKDDQYQLTINNELLTIDNEGNIRNRITFPGAIFDFWSSENDKTWVAALKAGSIDEYELWEISEGTILHPFYLKNQTAETKLSLNQERGNFIYRNQAGFWIVNTEGKIIIFDAHGNQLEEINQLANFNEKMRLFDIAEIEDFLFLSTDMGIIKVKILSEKFKTIYTKPTLCDSRGITETKEYELIFSEGQLYQVAAEDNGLKSIYSKTSGFAVYCADSFLLVGNGYNVNYSVFEKDLITGQIDYYPPYDEQMVYCIKPTSKSNQFWVGTGNGIGLIDTHQKDTIPFRSYNGFLDLESSRVKYIHQNQMGNWLATDKGVFLLDEHKGVLKQFNRATGDLPFNDINHIYEDSQGVFWLATNGAGLIKWQMNISGDKLSNSQVFNTTNGLSNNIVYSIYEDNQNRLWLSSNRGIVCLDKSSFQTKVFLEEDGLPHAEFNLTSHYQAKDSTLYFGGLGGLIAFEPNDLDLSFQTDVPLALISCEVLNDQALQPQDLMYQFQREQEVRLTRNAFLELKFQLLDFANHENHQYVYKIEGVSDRWTTTSGNSIRLASLPYGSYRLHIKGGNINTGWSNQDLIIKLSVPRPFYLQAWVFYFLVLMAGLMTWCFIKIRTRQLKKDRTLLAQKVKERTAQIEADKVIIEQQAQKLEALDQLKTNFFTNITHELRTPLSLILAPAGQLAEKIDRQPEDKVLVDSIYRNAQHLLGLTDELLDLAKIEAGTLDVKKSIVDIRHFLKLILNSYYEFSSYQQIDFSTELILPENLCLELDEKKMEKILRNLLSNAFKFTFAKGVIKVRVTWEEKQLKWSVSDNGQGIDPQDLPFIFDRYYQSKRRYNHMGTGGSGIGLAICKEYVQIMQGTIKAESELGKGTTFFVQIPVESASSVGVKNAQHIPALKEDLLFTNTQKGLVEKKPIKEHYRILIVEDNPELGHYLYNTLAEIYRVELAHNGKEAWQLLQQNNFDLLISDIMMPEMDGMELLTKAKAQKDYQQLPFLILTALTEPSEKMKALRIGVDDYLQKPFLIEELKIRIANLLNRYHIRKETEKEQISSLSADENWLLALEQITHSMLTDPHFTVLQLADAMNISERTLFNRLRAVVGITPGAYIREVRLNLGRKLLEQKKYKTVAEVCYAVGFQKPSYFTQVFKKRFGHLPSRYFK